MADVTLFFTAFPGPAEALQVESSSDGGDTWVLRLDTEAVGEYPNLITSAVVTDVQIDWLFRLRWRVDEDSFSEWSDPVAGSALPWHWTTPDLYRLMSQLALTGWSSLQLQAVIDRAWYLLQDMCGPYREDDPNFAPIAQLVIHALLDRMVPGLSKLALSGASGMKRERMGSYEYERFDNAAAISLSSFVVPPDLRALLCPFGIGDSGATMMETTQVFDPAAYHLAGAPVPTRVFTDADRGRLAFRFGPFQRWWA